MQHESPQVGPGPQQPGEPLRTLAGMHARTLRECEALSGLAERVAGSGCDEPCRRTAESLLGYFDAVPGRCHRIEQEGLFPALLESMAGSDPVCLRDMTSALSMQHRTLEKVWQSLRAPVAQLAAGRPAVLDREQVDAFVALNRSCIEREETELLPMASRLLTDEALAQLGALMGEQLLGAGGESAGT